VRFKVLSDEELIDAYLTAQRQKLDYSFLKLLLFEIIERGIISLLWKGFMK
jgi:hypothetical protein